MRSKNLDVGCQLTIWIDNMKKRSEPFAATEFREIRNSEKEIWEWHDMDKVFSQQNDTKI